MSTTPTSTAIAPRAAEGSGSVSVGRGRRGGRAVGLGVALAAVLVLASCTVPSNAPSTYDDAVKANFVQGCEGGIPETGGTTTTLAPADYCSCAYGVFVDQVPFNDDARAAFPNYPTDAPVFTTFNDDLAKSDNPQSVWDSLPQSVRDDIDRCPLPPGPVAPDGDTPSPSTAPADTPVTTAAG